MFFMRMLSFSFDAIVYRLVQLIRPFLILLGVIEPVFLQHRQDIIVHDIAQQFVRACLPVSEHEVAVSDAEPVAERRVASDSSVQTVRAADDFNQFIKNGVIIRLSASLKAIRIKAGFQRRRSA